MPPQWRPATTEVEIVKNRMELMAEICDVVSSANNTEVLDRIAGTDSSDSSGLQPASAPKKRTAVRGAAASDARAMLPPVLTPSSASPTPVPVARYTPPPPWWAPEATKGWRGWTEATGAAVQRALRTTRQRAAAAWWLPTTTTTTTADPTDARSAGGVSGEADSAGGAAAAGEAAAPVRVHVRVPGYEAGGDAGGGAARAAATEAKAPTGKVGAVQQQQQQQQQPQPQGAAQGAAQGALMEASQRPRPGSRADGPGDPWLSQRGPEQQMSEARRRQLAVLRQ